MDKVEFFFDKEPDIIKVKQTWEKAFNKKFNLDYWNWFFKSNPISDKLYIGYIMKNNVIVSYSAIQPSFIETEGGMKIKTGCMNMWMTHPDYQKRGYIVTILKELFKVMKNDGYKYLYSFPTRVVTWGLMKKHLDWTDVNTLHILKIKRNETRHLINKISFNTGIINSDVLNQTDKMVVLKLGVNICRTNKYLTWRFLNNPINTYKFVNVIVKGVEVGLLVYKSYNKEADIMEFFIDTKYESSKYELLLDCVNFLIGKKNFTSCNIWAMESSNLYNYLLNKNCFIDPLTTYFGYVNLQSETNIIKPSDWNISFMDSDVY